MKLSSIASSLLSMVPNAVIRPLQQLGRYALTFAIGAIFKFDKSATFSVGTNPLQSRVTYIPSSPEEKIDIPSFPEEKTDTDSISPPDSIFENDAIDLGLERTDSETSSFLSEKLSDDSLLIRDADIYRTMSSGEIQPRNAVINKQNLADIQEALIKTSHEPDHKLRMLMTTEILAKTYAYSRPPLGSTISIPSETTEGEMVDYIFAPMNIKAGIPLFILQPLSDTSSASPIVVFRGTVLSDSSVYEDISYNAVQNGIGKDLFNHCKVRLNYFVKTWAEMGKKPIFCGHSLGGCLTQHAAIEFEVGTYNAFNSPRVSFASAQKWSSIKDKPELVVVNTQGDRIADAGSGKIGTVITVVDSNPNNLSGLAKAKALHGETQLNRGKITIASVKNYDKSLLDHFPSFLSKIANAIKAVFAFIIVEPFNILAERRAHTEILTSTTVETSPLIIGTFATEHERKREAHHCDALLFTTYQKHMHEAENQSEEDRKLLSQSASLGMIGVLNVNAPNWYALKTKQVKSVSAPTSPSKTPDRVPSPLLLKIEKNMDSSSSYAFASSTLPFASFPSQFSFLDAGYTA